MIITQDNDLFLIKVFKSYIGDIDIYDIDNICNLFKDILFKVRNKYNLNGLFDIYVYINNKYGMIVEIYQLCSYENDMDVKIHFNIDCLFLCEIDDVINYDNVYYYKDKYYTLYDDKIDSYIIYKNTDDIINNGVKIR